jgi:hypothetical protein
MQGLQEQCPYTTNQGCKIAMNDPWGITGKKEPTLIALGNSR